MLSYITMSTNYIHITVHVSMMLFLFEAMHNGERVVTTSTMLASGPQLLARNFENDE